MSGNLPVILLGVTQLGLLSSLLVAVTAAVAQSYGSGKLKPVQFLFNTCTLMNACGLAYLAYHSRLFAAHGGPAVSLAVAASAYFLANTAPVAGIIGLTEGNIRKLKRRSLNGNRLLEFACLERLHVLSLPALRTLGHVELHRLALLQALEAARLDRREVHKNIFAILAADKAVALGVIKPLYCSLFCHVDTSVPFQSIYAGEIRRY
jgi:hypothetical protein